MNATTLARRLERLERGGKRLRPYPRLAPPVETMREALNTLLEIGAIELVGTALVWKVGHEKRQTV
jgi:hypothetical protein